MNTERAILKGRLAELKEEQMKLLTAISANLSAVQTFLAGWRVTKVEDIDIQSAYYNLAEAATSKKQLMELRADIAKVEQELA